MRLALICREVGHYHDSRFRSALARFEKFSVISVANEAGFPEFLAPRTTAYPVVRLYEGQTQFRSAVAAGTVASAIAQALDAAEPEVVAVGGWAAPESAAAIKWARRRGAGIVLMSDSQANDVERRSKAREYVKSRIVRQCDAGLVAGPTHLDYLVRLGMAPGKVRFGYDTIDNAHFAVGADEARATPQLRSALSLPDRFVLASARFIEKKNLPALVGAYARARAAVGDPPDLVILGDGPQRPAIEGAIDANGLQGRVHLPGFQGYNLLPAIYGLAEAFVHVSKSEQWGLVVNEAMAAGLPIIVSASCGAATLVEDGVNGAVVDALDDGAIADALARIFRLAPQQRAAMGHAGQTVIADWGPDRFADELRATAGIAAARRRRAPLAPWDSALLDRMSRMVIEDVA